MAVITVDPVLNLAASSQRGPSEALWANCPVPAILEDPSLGMYFFDDFLNVSPLTLNAQGTFCGDRPWASWATATNPSVTTDPGQEGGVLEITVGANNANEVYLSSLVGWARMVSAATSFPLMPKLYFEARVAVGSVSNSKRDVFIGLADHGNSILAATGFFSAADTISTTPGIFGFHARGATTNAGDFGVAFNVAGGTVQRPTNLTTLVSTVTGSALTAYTAGATGALATGFVKLGFIYDPNPYARQISSASSGQTAGNIGKPLITIFVNGQPAPAFLTGTNLQAATFPTGWMAPVIAYRSASATSPGDLYVDWVRCAMLANA